MKKILALAIGAILIAVGGLALWGAFDLLGTGATTEVLAQSFLVPASLFIVGGFTIWLGVKGGR